MMLKKFRCLALVLALILVAVSCTTFAAKKPIKLVFGNVMVADHYYSKGDRYFKELVEKNSKGQILIDHFPASQLGSEPEQWQAVKSGAQQMFFGGTPNVYWPKLITFELPYLYRDEAHRTKLAQRVTSLIDQDVMAAKTGAHILGVRLCSPRHLTTKFPVNKLEDVDGLKIRVPGNPLHMSMWRAFGAIPTVIPVADVYTALATGTVDAQENPFDVVYSFKFYEQVKYCALTAHVRSLYFLLINNNCWKSLTAQQQKILTDAVEKSNKMIEKMRKKNEAEFEKLLGKEGMKFTKPDVAPFRERVKTVWEQLGDQELIKKIQAVK
jgi:tripartite ATP-independent transporter DctP family solute receptor